MGFCMVLSPFGGNSMEPKKVFKGKKVLAVSRDEALLKYIAETIEPKGASYFSFTNPREALGNMMTKNPDLVIYDERLSQQDSTLPLSTIKRVQPKGRVLLVTQYRQPQRPIDTTAQGVTYSIPRDSQSQEMYSAIKHCLSISSVPRVEKE
ncbi:response regulator [bacterium]|nr:response regulator [bacterium]